MVNPRAVLSASVTIIEEPASKKLRFRYENEIKKRTGTGSIPGVHSKPPLNKTYPTIKIDNFTGEVNIIVSCVTMNTPYRPHPHRLVGRNCIKGVCIVKESVRQSKEFQFKNLGIMCVRRNDIEKELTARNADTRVDPFHTGFEYDESFWTSEELGAVRLAFQVFLHGTDESGKLIQLYPVVSDVIHDRKIPELRIIRPICGLVTGGTEIGLLCEKVTTRDKVVVYEENSRGRVLWKENAAVVKVYKQMIVLFRMPAYKPEYYDSQTHRGPIHLHAKLTTIQDKCSNSISFKYIPDLQDWIPDHILGLEPAPSSIRDEVFQHEAEAGEEVAAEPMSGTLDDPIGKGTRVRETQINHQGGDDVSSSAQEQSMDSHSPHIEGMASPSSPEQAYYGVRAPLFTNESSQAAQCPRVFGWAPTSRSPLDSQSPTESEGDDSPPANGVPLNMRSLQAKGRSWSPFANVSPGALSLHRGGNSQTTDYSPHMASNRNNWDPPLPHSFHRGGAYGFSNANSYMLNGNCSYLNGHGPTFTTLSPVGAQCAYADQHSQLGPSRSFGFSKSPDPTDQPQDPEHMSAETFDILDEVPSSEITAIVEKQFDPPTSLPDLTNYFAQDACESLSESLRRLDTNSDDL